MWGAEVQRLRVLLAGAVVFQRDGDYGDTWNYGQVTLDLTSRTTVSVPESTGLGQVTETQPDL